MAWRIDVAAAARPLLQTLDPSLREEVIEHGARIAENPIAELRRSWLADEPSDAYVYEYRSELVQGLRVRLFFRDLDPAARRLVLVGLAHVMEAEDSP